MGINLDHAEKDRPIGVFDSGVGGLSILRQLVQDFPEESFVYLGDTARLPYGTKSKDTIRIYAQKNLNYLLKNYNIKACVIACNSASVVVDDLACSVPIFDVIKPGAKEAVSALGNTKKNIGLWATQATVDSKAYEIEIHRLNKDINVQMISCPTLVSLVEEGFNKHPLLPEAFKYYLGQFTTEIDALILGCTHFPIFKKKLNKHLDFKITLVDSASGVSKNLKGFLTDSPEKQNTFLKILLTDTTEKFEDFAKKILTEGMTHFKNTTIECVNI